MHGDVEKIDGFRPVQKTDFPPKCYSWRKPTVHVHTAKENILTGDREKYKFWTSETKSVWKHTGVVKQIPTHTFYIQTKLIV